MDTSISPLQVASLKQIARSHVANGELCHLAFLVEGQTWGGNGLPAYTFESQPWVRSSKNPKTKYPPQLSEVEPNRSVYSTTDWISEQPHPLNVKQPVNGCKWSPSMCKSSTKPCLRIRLQACGGFSNWIPVGSPKTSSASLPVMLKTTAMSTDLVSEEIRPIFRAFSKLRDVMNMTSRCDFRVSIRFQMTG